MEDRSDSVVQLTRGGTILSAKAEALPLLRERFAREQCVRLPQLLEAGRAQALLDAIDGSEFFERIHADAGSPPPVDWCLNNDKISGELSFLLNDPALLALIHELTGCRVGSFRGVVYRLEPGRSYDAWHDDVAPHRMLAISINLTRGAYAGGLLQLRERKSGRVLHEVANTGLGDAILFRIAPHLQHRVTEIVGEVPRTAFAGWFASQPDFLSLLKARSHPPASDAA
jgi:hypothetical protein